MVEGFVSHTVDRNISFTSQYVRLIFFSIGLFILDDYSLSHSLPRFNTRQLVGAGVLPQHVTVCRHGHFLPSLCASNVHWRNSTGYVFAWKKMNTTKWYKMNHAPYSPATFLAPPLGSDSSWSEGWNKLLESLRPVGSCRLGKLRKLWREFCPMHLYCTSI